MTPAKKDMIYKAAMALLVANNTVTTLEIKVRLRKDVPNEAWYQDDISDVMRDFANVGKFDFIDNGTFRVYSGTPVQTMTGQTQVVAAPQAASPAPVSVAPVKVKAAKVKAKRKSKYKYIFGIKVKADAQVKYASRTTAKKMFENNKGHFFTGVFVKKDGTDRLINCQYLKDQSGADLGYIKVVEAALLRETKDPKKSIRNLNMQTLKAWKIGGQIYRAR